MNEANASRRPYRRTEAERTALESAVVDASLKLFAEGGYEAVSMRKLAAEVGVAPMSLYRYFPSKAHLMRHIWKDILAQAVARATVAASAARDPASTLKDFLNAFLDYWLDNADHYWVVFASRDDANTLSVNADAPALKPDLRGLLAELGRLLDGLHAPLALPAAERQHLVEDIVCHVLGFLAAVLGLAMCPPTEVHRLKGRTVDGIGRHVGSARVRLASTATR